MTMEPHLPIFLHNLHGPPATSSVSASEQGAVFGDERNGKAEAPRELTWFVEKGAIDEPSGVSGYLEWGSQKPDEIARVLVDGQADEKD